MKLTLSALFTLAMTAVASAESAGHDAPSSVFAGTIIQSIAAVIVFIILAVLLAKFAWGPILTGLQDREKKIKHDLEQAEANNKKAAATLKEYETKLAEARAEADRMVANARKEAEAAGAKVQEETRIEIDSMKKRATADIAFAKEQALTEIFTVTANLATDVAGKILRREITSGDQQRLVQESLAALKKEHLN